jgi:hypothetical protein
MKFFLTLIVLLNGEIYPKVFQYRFIDFSNLENCNNFLVRYQKEIKESIEYQFKKFYIKNTATLCMTQEEITKILNEIEAKKWQGQKHI